MCVLQRIRRTRHSIYNNTEMKHSDEEKIIGIIIDIKLNPIQDEEGGGGEGGVGGGWCKMAPYQFFPCNFYKRKN